MEMFTRIPNASIDEWKLNPYQFQLFSIIVRKTDGWCKVEDGISLSQFESLVTFKKPKIISTLKELVEIGVIEKQKQYDEDKKIHSYSVYKISKRVVSENNKGSNSGLLGVVCEDYKQKKLTTKETNTKTKEFDYFLSQLKNACKYKTKVTKTKEGETLFKGIEDKQKLFKAYIQHQIEKKDFAVRITSFMEDYKTVYNHKEENNNGGQIW